MLRSTNRRVVASLAVLVACGVWAAPAYAAPPPNDMFADATTLTGTDTTVAGDNIDATSEPGEESDAPSVWYAWTAPFSGSAWVSMPTTDFPGPLYAVYTGDSPDDLTRVALAERRFIARAGTTYRIRVHGGGEQGRFTLRLRHFPPPPNDAFADAVNVSGPSFSVSGSNDHASAEDREPDSVGASVWYRWTAPAAGRAILRMTANYEPMVRVYTGSDLANLKFVGHRGHTQYAFSAVPGTTYSIAVDSEEFNFTGAFTLALDLRPAPLNDRFENAQPLVGLSPSATGSNTDATHEPGEQLHYDWGDASVWYRWTAPATGWAAVDLKVSGKDRKPGVYTGDRVDALQEVASYYQPQTGFRTVAGTTYYIAADSLDSETGTVELSLSFEPTPPNDAFSDAVWLEESGEERSDRNTGATLESDEPMPANTGGASVWYAWTAPASGYAIFRVRTDDFMPLLAVYSGSELASLQPLQDQHDSDGHVELAIYAYQGETLRISVDGVSGSVGAFDLEFEHQPDSASEDPPVEDPPAEDPPAGEVHSDPEASPSRETAQSTPATGTPGPPPTPTPVTPSRPLGLAATFAPRRLRTVLTKGLTGTVGCVDTCTVEATATIDRGTAKRLGLKAAGSRVGSAAVQANGPTKVVIKLNRTAKRKLAKVKSLKLTVRITARGSDGRTATLTRQVKIKR